jgi:hypothetical protein
MTRSVFSFLFCITAFISFAQSNSKKEQAFIGALNKLVTTIPQEHWDTGEPMAADSIFHVAGDTISITWKYERNGSLERRRLAAPFSAIKGIVYDHYLVLDFEDAPVVRVYQQVGEGPWLPEEEMDVLHIGVVAYESKKQMKMKKDIEKAFADWKN